MRVVGWRERGGRTGARSEQRVPVRERVKGREKQPLRATDEEACKTDKQWYGEKGGRVRNGKQVRGEVGKRTEVRAKKLSARGKKERQRRKLERFLTRERERKKKMEQC